MRLRHKLRKLWSAGVLKVGGRLPLWLRQTQAEEASIEDVRKYLEVPGDPVSKNCLQVLPSPGWCVGKDRKSGRMLVSGDECLSPQYWETLLRGTREECLRYVNGR